MYHHSLTHEWEIKPHDQAKEEAARQGRRQEQMLTRMAKHRYPSIPLWLLEEGFVEDFEKMDMTRPGAPVYHETPLIPGYVHNAKNVDTLVGESKRQRCC
jgi:hypothetical protein